MGPRPPRRCVMQLSALTTTGLGTMGCKHWTLRCRSVLPSSSWSKHAPRAAPTVVLTLQTVITDFMNRSCRLDACTYRIVGNDFDDDVCGMGVILYKNMRPDRVQLGTSSSCDCARRYTMRSARHSMRTPFNSRPCLPSPLSRCQTRPGAAGSAPGRTAPDSSVPHPAGL